MILLNCIIYINIKKIKINSLNYFFSFFTQLSQLENRC